MEKIFHKTHTIEYNPTTPIHLEFGEGLITPNYHKNFLDEAKLSKHKEVVFFHILVLEAVAMNTI